MANVVVIGAGMGGLACAARLAAKGHDVNVIEQSHTWGGKLGIESHGGHVFDTGPSLVTLPAVYRDLFLKTGRPLEESVNLVDLDIAFRYQFADGTVLKMPGVGVGACAQAIGDAFGGKSAEQWKSFMHRAGQMWSATRVPFLESPLNGLSSLLSLSYRLKDLKSIAPGRTLRSLANHYFDDPRLVTLVDRYATYTGSDPRKAPAALATVPYIEQVFGAYHIAGGVRELGRALFERCESLGVRFTFDSSVTSINGGATVTSVSTSRGDVAAHIVVANADASVVYNSLLTNPISMDLTSRARKQLAGNTPSLSGFVGLIALRGHTSDLEHHNVWFPAHYDAEFDSIFGKTKMPVSDPTVYVCNPRDSQMAPEGSESWFVLVNAPRHDPDHGVDWSNNSLRDDYFAHIIGILKTRGFDIGERITWSSTLTPSDLESRTGAPGGSIYGSSSNGMRSAFLRPSNVTAIKNLYLVGGSSHPGGGLPLVAMSANIVAQLIGRA